MTKHLGLESVPSQGGECLCLLISVHKPQTPYGAQAPHQFIRDGGLPG